MGDRKYPLVNGHIYSFASIEIKIGVNVYIGVIRIDYSEEIDSVPIYGADPVRIGRTVGKRKLKAELELQRREWDFLLGDLGTGFGRKELQITVQYSEAQQPVITDAIVGWIVAVDSSNQDGTDPSAVKLTIDPMDIGWGASKADTTDSLAVEAPDAGGDGSFWLRTTDGIEGPVIPPNPWDTVILGGESLPGVCVVKGTPTLAFDKKKAGGIDGATITVNGYLPGPIEIEVTMWTPEQFARMKQIAPKLWTKPNKKTAAASLKKAITHPAFALWGITAVVVLGVSVPEKGPLEGTKVVKIKCVEYVPTKAQNKTKTAPAVDFGAADPNIVPPQNRAGDPPSKTDVHPLGKAVSRKGGVS